MRCLNTCTCILSIQILRLMLILRLIVRVLSAPVDAAGGVSLTPTITASGFVGTNNATHVSSTWQIAFTPTFGSRCWSCSSGGAYSSSPQISNTSGLVFTSTNDINNKTSVTIASGILEEGKTYYARVRYEYYDLQNTYWYSEWSEPIYFNTVAVPGELQCPSVASVIKSTIYDRMDVTSPFIATPAALRLTFIVIGRLQLMLGSLILSSLRLLTLQIELHSLFPLTLSVLLHNTM